MKANAILIINTAFAFFLFDKYTFFRSEGSISARLLRSKETERGFTAHLTKGNFGWQHTQQSKHR